MAAAVVTPYLDLVPAALKMPHRNVWISYDAAGDVLYFNFKKPSAATDSELTEDDIVLRYEGSDLVGVTILHASKR